MNKALLLLPLIFVSVAVAIWTGWLRIGWVVPVPNAVAQHGALMVGSFLATLIFLERAVTFKNKLVLWLPAVNGASVLFFLINQTSIAQWCLIVGSFGFCLMCGYFIYKYKELYYYVFFAGAFCLLAANVILLRTHFYPHAIGWWMAFLLFTIVAERLELSRFLPLSKTKRVALLLSLALTFISLFIPFHLNGNMFFAGSLTTAAAWLLLNDMARKSLNVKGQHRYSAVLLLCGYVWLFITAILLFVSNHFLFSYDAALHSFFIGFVFSMIFSHAPIILPAVLKLPIKLYRPVLYGWFVLLQVSLILRIIGDVTENILLRKWGGLLNGIVILLFFATVGIIVKGELLKRKRHLSKS